VRMQALADADSVARAGAAFTAEGGPSGCRRAWSLIMALSGVTPRGRCCVHWPMNRCHGPLCMWSRWTSGWRGWRSRPQPHPLRESLLAIVRSAPSRFMPCQVEAGRLGAASGRYA